MCIEKHWDRGTALQNCFTEAIVAHMYAYILVHSVPIQHLLSKVHSLIEMAVGGVVLACTVDGVTSFHKAKYTFVLY